MKMQNQVYMFFFKEVLISFLSLGPSCPKSIHFCSFPPLFQYLFFWTRHRLAYQPFYLWTKFHLYNATYDNQHYYTYRKRILLGLFTHVENSSEYLPRNFFFFWLNKYFVKCEGHSNLSPGVHSAKTNHFWQSPCSM